MVEYVAVTAGIDNNKARGETVAFTTDKPVTAGMVRVSCSGVTTAFCTDACVAVVVVVVKLN